MTVSAAIAFTQGVTVGAPGVAIIGVDGTPVVASNGSNVGVVTWQFTMVDVPIGSSLPIGIVQTGSSPTYTFTPDVSGGYLMLLTVFDSVGNFALDYRVFQVPETSGRIIPPFKATDQSLNFIISAVMNLRGWAPCQDAYDREVDILSSGGAGPTLRVNVTGPDTRTASLYTRYVYALGASGGSSVLNLPLGSASGARVMVKILSGTISGGNSLTLNAPFGGSIEELSETTGGMGGVFGSSTVFALPGDVGSSITWECDGSNNWEIV